MHNCLTADEIEELVTGVLPSRRNAEAERHIEQCTACLERVEQSRADEAVVAGLRRASSSFLIRKNATGPAAEPDAGGRKMSDTTVTHDPSGKPDSRVASWKVPSQRLR